MRPSMLARRTCLPPLAECVDISDLGLTSSRPGLLPGHRNRAGIFPANKHSDGFRLRPRLGRTAPAPDEHHDAGPEKVTAEVTDLLWSRARYSPAGPLVPTGCMHRHMPWSHSPDTDTRETHLQSAGAPNPITRLLSIYIDKRTIDSPAVSTYIHVSSSVSPAIRTIQSRSERDSETL